MARTLLTKEEKHLVYLEALRLLKKEKLWTYYGLCYYLSTSVDTLYKLHIFNESLLVYFPEVFDKKPSTSYAKKHLYWWPQNPWGYWKRYQFLKAVIKETKS